MHLEPAGDERTSELTASPPEPTPIAAVREPRADRADRNARPTLVLRPQIHWRLAGPGLILFALVLLAAGRLRAAPFALILFVIGVTMLPAIWERVDVSPDTIVHHGFRQHRAVPLAEIDAFRLRRIAFPFLRFIHSGYKVGRYWSIPLTVRLLHRDEPLLELRCGWWDGWRELSRYIIVTCPDVDLDGRTRGRLERYVGVPLPPIDKA
jgi:hypothetical protein